MDAPKFDLVVRFDGESDRLVFFTLRRDDDASTQSRRDVLAVDIPLAKIRRLGPSEAEELVGSSVLGFFDNLLPKGLRLKKHYRDK